MAPARRLSVLVVALVVLGGCAAVDTAPGGTAGGAATADGPGIGGAVTTSVAAGSLVPETADATVTVTDVVDGDTLDVRYPNGTTDTVRLLGVDTPEVHTDTNPAEFEGVPDSAAGRRCLREAGENASVALTARLARARVRLAVDPESDRRDRYDRLLAYVLHDGRNVNYWLVAAGHARMYDTQFRYAEAFGAAERTARDRSAGVWRCRDPAATDAGTAGAVDRTALEIAAIHADASGNDHENLPDEYLVFRNAGDDPLDVSGWTVTDAADHAYTFPGGAVLAARGRLTLHTGAGTDDDGHYYWHSDTAVWNNDGDTITVYDADGRAVLSTSY